jgi:hypothetical protein
MIGSRVTPLVCCPKRLEVMEDIATNRYYLAEDGCRHRRSASAGNNEAGDIGKAGYPS